MVYCGGLGNTRFRYGESLYCNTICDINFPLDKSALNSMLIQSNFVETAPAIGMLIPPTSSYTL
jgi:hypothetical protein